MARKKTTGGRGGKKQLYIEFLSPEDVEALGDAAVNGGLEQEIKMLRLKLHEALGKGANVPQLVQAVKGLAAVLKVQHSLKGTAAQNLEEALAKVLEEIGNELGT